MVWGVTNRVVFGFSRKPSHMTASADACIANDIAEGGSLIHISHNAACVVTACNGAVFQDKILDNNLCSVTEITVKPVVVLIGAIHDEPPDGMSVSVELGFTFMIAVNADGNPIMRTEIEVFVQYDGVSCSEIGFSISIIGVCMVGYCGKLGLAVDGDYMPIDSRGGIVAFVCPIASGIDAHDADVERFAEFALVVGKLQRVNVHLGGARPDAFL